MTTAAATTATATRCAIYLRQSLDVTGDELAVARQRQDCLRIVAARGWVVHDEYKDNSASASDRTKKRPQYDRMVLDYQAGRFGAVVCYDLDRLTRQPRQLEDWIDAATERGLVLVTANGEADLSTDAGRLFARIKASVARAEIERKSARQKRAAQQRAELGRMPLGTRLTGYNTDGTLRRGEAEMVQALFRRFHAGESLRSLTAWLNTDAPTATRRGGRWNPSTIRTILTNPRYAGKASYLGEPTGQAGQWEPLVDEATFLAVNDTLSNVLRRTQWGTDRKYLGTSLFRCGICGRTVRSHSGGHGADDRGSSGRYRCPTGGHFTRTARPIDALVLDVLRERLAQPDLADALAPQNSPEAVELTGRTALLRARLAQIESDYDAGLIDGHRFRVATDKVQTVLNSTEAERIRLAASAGVAATLTAADPVAAFDAAPLTVKRAILDYLMTVTLYPARSGVRRLDPATVQIDWRA